MEYIAEKVVQVIADSLNVPISDVTPSAGFVDDLRADSLDLVELIMAFEKEFSITIPDEDSEYITTVEDTISYVTEKVRQNMLNGGDVI